jgi:hypothetical protein
MRPACVFILLALVTSCGAPRQLEETEVIYRWSANIRGTEQRTGRVGAPIRTRMTGTAHFETSRTDSLRTRAVIFISSETFDRSVVRWALLPGRCGEQRFPLLPFDLFPPIDLSRGRGSAEVELPVRLEPGASYFVNILVADRLTEEMVTQPAFVLACGNLR